VPRPLFVRHLGAIVLAAFGGGGGGGSSSAAAAAAAGVGGGGPVLAWRQVPTPTPPLAWQAPIALPLPLLESCSAPVPLARASQE
jgi:hypothetical protein